LKKRKDIIINYSTQTGYDVRKYIKSNHVTTITIYIYKKELFVHERVAKVNIIILSPFPKFLGNEIEREAYERVH
jgi:hypothetical protein